VADQSIAVCYPQCHIAQHVISIAFTSCNLLAHPLLMGEGCPVVLVQCGIMHVPAALLPVQGEEEGQEQQWQTWLQRFLSLDECVHF